MTRTWITAVALGCVAVAAGLPPTFAKASADKQDRDKIRIKRKLSSTKVSVDFPDITFQEFARRIAQLSAENVVIMGIDEAEMPSVSIRLTGVTLETVLGLVLSPNDFIYTIEDGVIVIKNKTAEKVVLDMYDVKDLTAPLRDFPGVDVYLASNTLGVDTQTPDADDTDGGITGDILVELIQAHTAGDSWDDLPGTSVSFHSGILIVRQTKRNQRIIERFIGRLRSLK